MENNYTIKSITKSIAILAIALNSVFVNAQTATTYDNIALRVPADTYPAGSINVVTDEIAVEGVTFKIQATVTPSSTAADAFIQSTTNRRWGVNNTVISGDLGESAIVDGITIIDFNAGTTAYDVSAISDVHFYSFAIFGAQHTSDNPSITVNGTASGTTSIGQVAKSQTVIFGESFANTAGTNITIGSNDVTSVKFANTTEVSGEAYQVISTPVSYTFTKDDSLSLDDNTKEDNSFNVFPTITDNTFSVSREFKTLKIIDVTGKTVKTFNTSDALSVSGLGSGMYIVKLESEIGGLAISRLIVK